MITVLEGRGRWEERGNAGPFQPQLPLRPSLTGNYRGNDYLGRAPQPQAAAAQEPAAEQDVGPLPGALQEGAGESPAGTAPPTTQGGAGPRASSGRAVFGPGCGRGGVRAHLRGLSRSSPGVSPGDVGNLEL